MQVSQWNILPKDARISGLRRYDDKIFELTSAKSDFNITRYQPTGKKSDYFMKFKKGEITHITTHQLAFLKTIRHVPNCVVTVHDIIQHHWYPMKRKLREYWFLNEMFLKDADFFIADSNYTKNDLIESFKIPEEKIQAIYLGVDRNIFFPVDREKSRTMFGFKENEVVLLSVSSGEPWKNTELLKKLPYKVIDMGYGRGKLGTVTDETIRSLYSACDAFLSPSKAEGFGLPALEAMACGTPVIASDNTSLPEVVGQGGFLVNPDDICDWENAIDMALMNREKWSKKALNQSKKFTWQKCGKETLDVYKRLLE